MMKKQKFSKLKNAIKIASVTSFFVLTYCNYSAAAEIGDINKDNKISKEDSNFLKSYLVKQVEFTDEQKTYADINGDGKITITDLSLLKAKYSGDNEEKKLESLEIVSLPTKLTYMLGEKFDPSGLVVMATYTNGEQEDVTSKVTLSKFNSSGIGSQVITVTYETKAVSFSVTMTTKLSIAAMDKVTSIRVSTLPEKTIYKYGENLDLKGLSVVKRWSNGATQTIDNYTVSGYNPYKTGKQTLTITYIGLDENNRYKTFNTTFTIRVVDYIEELEVIPTKTELEYGETLKYTAIATYASGEEIDISKNVIVEGFDSKLVGNQTVKYKYTEIVLGEARQFTGEFEVTVKQNLINVTGVKLNKSEATIKVDEQVELIATVLPEDASNKNVVWTSSDENIAIVDKNGIVKGISDGTATITVTTEDGNYKASAKITVEVENIEKRLVEIRVKTKPNKTVYYQNETTISLEGAELELIYNDASTEIIEITTDMISGFNTSTIGTKQITVEYKGYKSTFEIEVIKNSVSKIEFISEPTKKTYIQNYETLNVDGGKLKITYDDGSSSEINITKEMVSNFDNSILGKRELTVKYSDKELKYEIEIVEKSLIEIRVKTKPDKTIYYQNETTINLDGAQLELIYNDTSTEIIEITTDMISGFNTSTIGTKQITVEYEGYKSTFDIEVIENNVTSIEIASRPSKTTYIQNYENLDVSGGKILVRYADGTNKQVEITENMVSGFNNSQLGNINITVTYGKATTTFVVEIVEKSIVNISVEGPNKKTYYQYEEEIDLSGLNIHILYNDESEETRDISNEIDKITGFDTSTLGKKQIKLIWRDYEISYNIEVIENNVTSIEMLKNPTKTTYIQNYENLDVSGGKILVKYADGTSKEIEITENMVSGFSNSTLGKINIVVTYEGATTTFTVEIVKKSATKLEIVNLPNKLDYTTNDTTIDLTGGIIKITYNDGTTENFSMTVAEASGFNNTVEGTQVITIKYMNLYATYTINVKQVFSAYLDKTNLVLDYGTEGLLTLTVNIPAGGSYSVRYGTSNTSVAELSAPVKYNGYMEFAVVPTGGGTATLSFEVTYNGEVISLYCDVTVNKDATPVESVTLDKTYITAKVGDTFTLTPTIYPANADDIVNYSWEWTCVEEINIECLDGNTGTFSVIGPGSAIIEFVVTTKTGEFRAQCELVIIEDGIATSSVLSSVEQESSAFSRLSNGLRKSL